MDDEYIDWHLLRHQMEGNSRVSPVMHRQLLN